MTTKAEAKRKAAFLKKTGRDVLFWRGGDARFNENGAASGTTVSEHMGHARGWLSQVETGKITISLYDYLEVIELLCEGTDRHPALALRKYLDDIDPEFGPEGR